MQPNCAPTRAALISGQYPARDGNGVYNVVSLKDGWKLVHWMNQNETELYILADDVGERNDLSQAQPQRTREMLATLNDWVKETRQKK
jgi:arylsulfatase A-like enzyme